MRKKQDKLSVKARLFELSSDESNGESYQQQSRDSSEDVSNFGEPIYQTAFPEIERVSTVGDYVFVHFDDLKNVLNYLGKI